MTRSLIGRSAASRLAGVVGALVIAALVGMGVSACSTASTAQSSASAVSLPTGTAGAADFDRGYLSVGSGAKTVDLYFDPLCPYCNEFEKTNGATLAKAVDAGTITLRLHPLTFLDPSSNGTQYSSRAGAALTCVATVAQDATLDYLAALYSHQPAEGSAGLSDKQLVALASRAGSPDIADCLSTGRNQAWAQAITQRALSGPLVKGADIPAIKGTPTVLVDGRSFTGSITDRAAFSKFLAST